MAWAMDAGSKAGMALGSPPACSTQSDTALITAKELRVAPDTVSTFTVCPAMMACGRTASGM